MGERPAAPTWPLGFGTIRDIETIDAELRLVATLRRFVELHLAPG